MKHKFGITGLDCPNCAAKLSAMIEAKEEITTAKINFLTEKVTVESELPEEAVFAIVKDCASAFSSSVAISR